MAYKLFIDTNVFLDFLMQRGKDWENAKAIFDLAEQDTIEIYTSASSVLNIMYVMSSYKLGRREIIAHASSILSFTKLINPDNITFEIALSSSFKDLEDAVQYHTALNIQGVNYFITSNTRDYKSSMDILPVLSPVAFMDRYNSDK
jgi:predicted nucleic acid-binding protein